MIVYTSGSLCMILFPEKMLLLKKKVRFENHLTILKSINFKLYL